MIILEICENETFDFIAITPRGTFGVCCVHLAKLITYAPTYTLPFT